MRRRTVLCATAGVVAGAFTGCISNTGGSNAALTDDASPTPTATSTKSNTPETAFHQISGVSPDSSPDLPISPAVSVADDEETAESPSRISIRWHNESDESLRLGERMSVFFQMVVSDENRAWLLGNEWRGGYPVAFDDCWHVSDDIVADGDFEWLKLEAEGTFEVGSALYATNKGCLSGGTYRFEALVFTEIEGQTNTAEWGFDLEVEDEG